MRTISFAQAVKRFSNSFVLCNNVPEIDPSIWENAYFDFDDAGEIMQYYITDCSAEDVKYLSSWFGLLFAYSEVLDCFVLCVDHWGTRWDGVMIEDKSPIC
jgi:hypothetical protein